MEHWSLEIIETFDFNISKLDKEIKDNMQKDGLIVLYLKSNIMQIRFSF